MEYINDETVAKMFDLDVPIIGNIIKHTYSHLGEFKDENIPIPIVCYDICNDIIRAAIIACAVRWAENGTKDEIKYKGEVK